MRAALPSPSASHFPAKRLSRVLLAASLLLTARAMAQDFTALDAVTGQALFERNWVAAPASTAAADGLGPYYNARSCAACHPGGGGRSEVAALNLVANDPVYGELLQARAITGLSAEASANITYEPGTEISLADGTRVMLYRSSLTLGDLQQGPLQHAISIRRAPGLAGLGLLEQVPLDVLDTLADPEDRNGDGISGRVAPKGGRFGWKAGVASLRAQTARALSLDLGLGNPLFPDPAGDCTPAQQACLEAARARTGNAFEAPEVVLGLLVTYLQALPPPRSGPVAEGPDAALFSGLGCAACHVPQLGPAVYPFSDLLIHDMGAGLADQADSASATAAEWRTPPLWGLGLGTRFLHDGRAATVEEAILWHGGEASASAAAYRNLNAGERARLLGWLLGL